RLLLFDRLFDPEEPVHFLRAQRHRHTARAHELDHALDPVDDPDGLLVQDHVHQHVARVDLALHRHLLAVLDLHHVLRRHQGLADRLLLVGPRIVADAALDERAHLVLMPRGRLNRVPAMLVRHQNSFATIVTKTSCSSESIRPISRPRASTKTTITPVAFLSSSVVGHVTRRISARTSRRNSSVLVTHPRFGLAAGVCCTAGSTSATPPARGACAGSWSSRSCGSCTPCTP